MRITDSFTHYHPVDTGFDEFYLVQMSNDADQLLTSYHAADIESPQTMTPELAQQLFDVHDIRAGDLIYLPRGVIHRGLGGVLAQVITVPGFRPGAEIGVDHHLLGDQRTPRSRRRGRPALQRRGLDRGGHPLTRGSARETDRHAPVSDQGPPSKKHDDRCGQDARVPRLPIRPRTFEMKQTSDAESYDAVVVGSGATGGWTAKVMTEAGMDVLMLEAGRAFDPENDFREHTLPHDMPLRGRPDPRNELLNRRQRQSYCYACTEVNADFFIDDVDNPYTEAPGTHFNWIQGNVVGGRSIMWARQSYRMSDYDFKAASMDGYGMDWPISYADISPTTTGSSGTSASTAARRDSRSCPTATSCRRWPSPAARSC